MYLQTTKLEGEITYDKLANFFQNTKNEKSSARIIKSDTCLVCDTASSFDLGCCKLGCNKRKFHNSVYMYVDRLYLVY